ncbi:MAG: DNA internalization-related competence protein ComEC/Rec2 [Rhodanobacter sp.]
MESGAAQPSAGAAAVALAVGVLLVQWLPRLPSTGCAALALLGLLAWPLRRWRWLLVLVLGIGWALWRGAMAMDARLPQALEGRDLVVVGTLVDLPQHRSDATRFTLDVQHAALDGQPVALQGLVTLAWYQHWSWVMPCSRWRLTVRLKRPRGLLNPGTADSERSALERGIHATGYVRDEAGNAMLGQPGWCVDGVRERIARGIAAHVADARDAALLQALAVGDTRGLLPRDWEVARANGVSHLIAISGFHVGVAAVFGVGVVWLVFWLWPSLALRLPRVQAQAAAALGMAWIYSALAGFGLPTVRTLLMIAVVALARCTRRSSHGFHALALALLAILLVDPLAVLSAGFWLSFIGVGFLMLCLQSGARGWRGFLHELTRGQWVMTVGLLPLTLWFFGQASLVGAASNLVAVPFVSFVIVPCVLVGTLCVIACPPLASPVWWLAARLMHAQWWLLECMAAWPGAHWYLPSVKPLALLLALLGALWMFLPRGVPLRWLGALLFLPLLLPPRVVLPAGGFQVWVLDVGQGLAVLVRTRGHALIYDTGARYRSGFDLGDAVVIPAVHALGIGGVDTLVVTHADNDHAGGAAAVAAAFPAAHRLAGEPARMPVSMRQCVAGQRWQWDGVRFLMLNPTSVEVGGKGNDRSCVLLVEGPHGRMLLTGDISKRVEPQVAARLPTGVAPVLLVPHHGSKSASSAEFIAALRPPLAVVSAGWRNRFGHPRAEVLSRYAAARVPVLNTAVQGAIALDFPADGAPIVHPGWRAQRPRYWRE